MAIYPRSKYGDCASMKPMLPTASTTLGFFNSTDIGKPVVASSNTVALAVGTTADTSLFVGIVGAVPVASTPASTEPVYIRPILKGEEYEGDYSTTLSTNHPATTDIGKFIGFSNTTTVAGAVFDMSRIGNSAGSTSGLFMRITGFSTERRKIFGQFNSSHLAD